MHPRGHPAWHLRHSQPLRHTSKAPGGSRLPAVPPMLMAGEEEEDGGREEGQGEAPGHILPRVLREEPSAQGEMGKGRRDRKKGGQMDGER